MRTRLILAKGANHAQINPLSTHSRCVHLENARWLKLVLEPLVAALRRRVSAKTKVAHAPKCALAMPTTAASSSPMMCIMPKRNHRRR